MSDERTLSNIIGADWGELLGQIGDAVIVMDDERQLQFANPAARRLLGFREGEIIGGRCRKTMRGTDCEAACPLTYALDRMETVIRDFRTVYTTRDGRDLPLQVTVLPLRHEDGSFSGAVEILRPLEADFGFILAGRGSEIARLRQCLTEIAATDDDLIFVGEPSTRAEAARCLHRMTGLDDEFFHEWTGSWRDLPTWPPGTAFADGDDVGEFFAEAKPEGWRRVGGVDAPGDIGEHADSAAKIVHLPRVDQFREDLPEIVAAWARQIKPGLEISGEALEWLSMLAGEHGLSGIEKTLRLAVAAADGRLEAEHFPGATPETLFVDQLLLEPDPLAALEKRLLLEVLERSEWRMQEASDRLGMSRVTLWRKLKDHEIQRPENGD